MLPHQQRVVVEEAELSEKIRKLGAFLDGEAFKTLPPDERRLLSEQYRYMVGYKIALEQRMRMFGVT